MKWPMSTAAAFILGLTALTSAQLLTNGNSQLPSCAANCPILNQAAQACGGTTTANQQIWSCFCQSGYLKSLYNSPSGICDSTCTSTSDAEQVMTWFKTNCGTDDGASEHAGSASSSTSSAAVAASTSNAAQPSTTASGATVDSDSTATSGGTWWSQHYKWVIMLIVIFVGLVVIAFVAVYLKRRHDRKVDQAGQGFNNGISTTTMPVTSLEQGANGAGEPSRSRRA